MEPERAFSVCVTLANQQLTSVASVRKTNKQTKTSVVKGGLYQDKRKHLPWLCIVEGFVAFCCFFLSFL